MGALTGALFGGLGGAGETLGSLGKLGTTCKALERLKNVAKISGIISLGMGTFDLLAWGAGLFAPDNAFTAFNQQLHSNGLYNAFQFGASALAVFSLGGIKGFYEKTPNPVCFVAGTMVLTASGLTAIEKIRAGDKVISTNAETFETEEKLVLETYIRQTDKLIHLVINGEEIITTETHPFYVKDRGFVDAGGLLVGDSLLDVHGNVLLIEDIQIEYPEEPTTVYNFQVEDFHTYYVGTNCIFVHNANCMPSDKYLTRIEENGDRVYTREIDGQNIEITYTRNSTGDFYPRFEGHAHPQYSTAIKAEFKMTGNQAQDIYYMNRQVFGGSKFKPNGYTWHHLEDGESMLLVNTRIHSKFHHQGGAQVIRNK